MGRARKEPCPHVPSRAVVLCGGGACPRCQPWGDTLPSLRPDPWAHQAILWAQAVVSPPPADKRVSSSPMKAVEGSDMMKAGRCPLPWEERSFQAASPSLLHHSRLAATAAAPRRAARCLSKPRAENSRHCNHRVWFFFHPTVGLWLRAPTPQPYSMSLLQFHPSCSVCSFSAQGGGSRVPATGSYRARGTRLPELGGLQPALC